MVLVGDEQNVAPDRIGLRRDLGDPLQDRALKVELEQHAERPRQTGIHRDRKIQAKHVPRLEQLVQWRQRSCLAFCRRLCVHLTWWTKGPIDIWGFVE